MSYADKIEARPKVIGRHSAYEAFLLEPIADTPATAKTSYEDWEFDHGSSQRFYVGGIRWFMRSVGISDAAKLSAFGPDAAKICKKETTWGAMPNSGELWNSCSLNQFRWAKNRKPMFFQKAALVILSCELALADLNKRNQPTPKPVTVADIYERMTVVPACWNINDFNIEFIKRIEDNDANAFNKMRDAAGQSAKTFIDHLASGFTVTSPTAFAVKKFVDTNHADLTCGAIRSRPGAFLGTLNATEFEDVDVS